MKPFFIHIAKIIMAEKYLFILPFSIFFANPLLHSQEISTTIKFDERVHDFGTILEKNGKVSHTFIFHNTGKSPDFVTDIFSGCGCIGKVMSKAPVAPGGKGEVTIIFNPEYKTGFFSKEIVVYSNNGHSFNRIWVQGTIIPSEHPIEDDYPYNFGNGLFLRLKVVAFGYLKPGETKQMDLHYANNTNSETTLSFFVEGNKTGLKFKNPGKLGPKMKGVLTFSYTMPDLSTDDVLFTLDPYVNGIKLGETLQVRILNQRNAAKK
jgi:hypothetical protein